MHRSQRLLRLLPLAALLAPVASGQAPAAPAAPAAWDSTREEALRALAKLSPGKPVRVVAAGSGRLEGRFVARTDTTLSIQGLESGEAHDVPIANLDSLWVRRSGARTGLVIGGLFGALLGGMGGAMGCSFPQAFSGAPRESCTGETWGGAVVGAVAVGAVGALIGSALRRWSRVAP